MAAGDLVSRECTDKNYTEPGRIGSRWRGIPVTLGCVDQRIPNIMYQIKIFRGLENETDTLEKGMNRWLAESGAKIVNIFGNMSPQSPAGKEEGGSYLSRSPHAPSDIFLVVVYEKD